MVGGYIKPPYINTDDGGGGEITRNFTTLDATFSMHYTIQTVALTGDFEVEAVYSTTSTDSENTILGEEKYLKIRTNASGYIQALVGNGTGTWQVRLLSNVVVVNDGKLHTVKLTRVGNLFTLFSDGVNVEVGGSSIPTPRFPSIGFNTGTGHGFTGTISDVKITDAGTLIRNYAIDETWAGPSTVLVDTENGMNGTAVNIDVDDSENFTFDGSVSPNTWTNDDELRVIEVAGT